MNPFLSAPPVDRCHSVGVFVHARTHVVIHAYKSDVPSDSLVGACFYKPVAFTAVITVNGHGIQ